MTGSFSNDAIEAYHAIETRGERLRGVQNKTQIVLDQAEQLAINTSILAYQKEHNLVTWNKLIGSVVAHTDNKLRVLACAVQELTPYAQSSKLNQIELDQKLSAALNALREAFEAVTYAAHYIRFTLEIKKTETRRPIVVAWRNTYHEQALVLQALLNQAVFNENEAVLTIRTNDRETHTIAGLPLPLDPKVEIMVSTQPASPSPTTPMASSSAGFYRRDGSGLSSNGYQQVRGADDDRSPSCCF